MVKLCRRLLCYKQGSDLHTVSSLLYSGILLTRIFMGSTNYISGSAHLYIATSPPPPPPPPHTHTHTHTHTSGPLPAPYNGDWIRY